ncbi:hypothetical protein B0H14DRAFT_2582925 [Mycena olivaceomarginata]|nr:hypothetical protein B0H14DRAFT_2582925 [Mycena olivaceomarginata]
MPPPTWTPPTGIEPFLVYSADKTQVQCTLCHQEGKANVGCWISRKNLKAHLKTTTHLACYNNHLARVQARSEQLEELADAYGAEGLADYPAFPQIEPSYVPPMFSESDPGGDIPLHSPRANVSHLIEELGQAERPVPPSPEETRALLRREYEQMLEDVSAQAHLDEDTGVEGFFGDDMPKETEEDEDKDCFDFALFGSAEYHPYPSKTAMLLDVMDNLPRCRFTSAQMSLIIHFANQLGAADVPSLKGLRKIQQNLQLNCRQRTPGPISETYQAARWMEYTPAQLTPMLSHGFKRFWIEELARLSDGTYVIPHTWIVRDGILTSDTTVVTLSPDGRWEHHIEVDKLIEADDLELDYTDIRAEYRGNIGLGDDEDLFVIMVSLWADDVSGNKSKQYNKHMNMFILRTPGLPADNPQQSEECSHMGSNANFPCRKCHWGRTKVEKESDAWYHAGHLTGVARNAQEIRESLEEQLRLAMLGDPKPVEEHQQKSGTKDKVAQYWVETLIRQSQSHEGQQPTAFGHQYCV